MEPEVPVEAPAAKPHRWRWVIDELRGADARTWVVLTAAALLLIVFKQMGGQDFFDAHLKRLVAGHPRTEVIGDLYWFASCFWILGLVPMALLFRLGFDAQGAGLGLGDRRFGLRGVALLYAVMFPVIAVASRFESFWRYYPLNDMLARESAMWVHAGAPSSWLGWFVVYEIGYAIYFIGWEYFYRGFLLFGLYPRLGFAAVLVGNVPFALMHAGKPFAEAIGSIVAGVALGLFALRARSFWYGWLLHALIAISMDLLAILSRVSAE